MTTQTLSAPARYAPKPGNSVEELFPDLVRRWDFAANYPLTPADVSRASSQVVFWICESGHPSFKARVASLTRTGPGGQAVNGCPECVVASRRAPRVGRKSLADEFPDVASQWDYEANYPRTPEQVAPRSNQKAWFACPEHGSTLSYISNRTAGHGCPSCGKAATGRISRAAAVKRGTLAGSHPGLAAEWSTELNDLTAEQVSPGSSDRGWWDCPEGHAPYRAAISRRVHGSGCPVCGHLRRAAHLKTYGVPKPGRSLADLRPEVAAFWDATRNELTPHDVGPYGQTVINWACDAGHSFQKRIQSMTQSTSCPVCRALKKAASLRG